MNEDFTKYVDVFYGSGAVDHFPQKGAAAGWFPIKALCGNTIPHAALPFSLMTVGPYSGGYPSGYGTHYPNSCGGIRTLTIKNPSGGRKNVRNVVFNGKKLKGFRLSVRELSAGGTLSFETE